VKTSFLVLMLRLTGRSSCRVLKHAVAVKDLTVISNWSLKVSLKYVQGPHYGYTCLWDTLLDMVSGTGLVWFRRGATTVLLLAKSGL
jgi:hypothetical protein